MPCPRRHKESCAHTSEYSLRLFPRVTHDTFVQSPALLTCAFLLSLGPLPAASTIQLRVVEGEGTVYPTASRATRGLTVLVTGEDGNPVQGAAVSFRLPEDGPGGTFTSGLRTEVVNTKADGRAAVWGMQWNRLAGPFDIRITAAKDDARAGIVSHQYLTDALSAKNEKGFSAPHRVHAKWVLIGALAGGAAAGLALGHSGHSSLPVPVGPVAPAIGTPTLIIGPHP